MDTERLKQLWLSNIEDNQELLLNIMSSQGLEEEESIKFLQTVILAPGNIRLKPNIAEKLAEFISSRANKIYKKRVVIKNDENE